MASDMVKECGVCNNEFNEEERCPRNLPCSHCLCSSCISELINRNGKICPFCRQSFDAKSVQELGKNTFSLDLLKYIKDLEAKIASPANTPATSRSKMLEELKKESENITIQNITSCQVVAKQLRDTINRNNEIQGNTEHHHKKIKGEITDKLNELEEKCGLEVQFIKELNEGLKRKLDEVQEKEKEAQTARKKLQEATTLVKVDSAIDKAEASNASLQNWLQDIGQLLATEVNVHERINTNIKNTEGILESVMKALNSTQWTVDDLAEDTEDLKSQLNIQWKLTTTMLKTMNSQTKDLVRANKVYAVQEIDGKRRIAKLSFAEEKLLLHYLKEEILPRGAFILEHNEVMKLVDPSSRLCFLEFGTEETTLGRIFIRLRKDKKRSQNFALLCTGQMGVTYANTNIITVIDKGNNQECIHGGDYESNDGSGGKELVPGTVQESPWEPWRKGTVSGGTSFNNASQYYITTKISPGSLYAFGFGHVVSGLDVVTTTIPRYPKISDVKVTDCGIVLLL